MADGWPAAPKDARPFGAGHHTSWVILRCRSRGGTEGRCPAMRPRAAFSMAARRLLVAQVRDLATGVGLAIRTARALQLPGRARRRRGPRRSDPVGTPARRRGSRRLSTSPIRCQRPHHAAGPLRFCKEVAPAVSPPSSWLSRGHSLGRSPFTMARAGPDPVRPERRPRLLESRWPDSKKRLFPSDPSVVSSLLRLVAARCYRDVRAGHRLRAGPLALGARSGPTTQGRPPRPAS